MEKKHGRLLCCKLYPAEQSSCHPCCWREQAVLNGSMTDRKIIWNIFCTLGKVLYEDGMMMMMMMME